MSTATMNQVDEQGIEALEASQVDESASAVEESTLLGLDAKTEKLMEQNDAAIAEITALAVEILDPRDALRKYAKLGARVLKHAQWQKSKFPAWAKEDYHRLCDKVADQVKFQVPIKDVRMDVYVRVCVWVAAVKVMIPDVEKLSYHQVAYIFLPTLDFDPVELTGEIKSGWHKVVAELVAQQIGSEPLSMKALTAKIAEHKADLEREKAARRDPEKALEQERKAAESKARRERASAQSKVSDAIDKALVDSHADANDVVQIVQKVLKDHKLEMPGVGLSPDTCSPADLKTFFNAMWGLGRIAEIKAVHEFTGKLVAMFEKEAAAAERKSA